MFSRLPELFGRNFLVGYVLPAALIVFAIFGVTDLHKCSAVYAAVATFITSGSDKLPIGQISGVIIAIWALGVLLLGINDSVTRLLEGYGAVNPAKLWRQYSLTKYKRLKKIMRDHDDARDDTYGHAAMQLAERFPESDDLVLPTRFGNVMRAAERYPQVIYAIDPIQVWPRLLSVAPDTHTAALEDSKAALDFWINLWFGAIVVILVQASFWVWKRSAGESIGPYVIPLAFVGALTAAKLAQSAAREFGNLVKATFDLYRRALCAQLNLDLPHSLQKERELWQAVSQTMLFRDSEAADDMTPFRSSVRPIRTD